MIHAVEKKQALLALAMIVRGADEEAEVFARCLKYTIPYVDQAFITITHAKGEKPSAKVIQAAEMFDCEISYFEWVDDFAAARNFNFAQVPKEFEYIFWLDADDVPRGLENLKSVIKKHRSVDAFSLMYLYAFDEYKNPVVVHQKTRVLRNDGCVTWVGQLHEDFAENRSVTRSFIKDIDVLHLTDDSRISTGKTRNLQIARKMQEDNPDDPRSYWNLGNSQRAAGLYEQASQTLEKFLEMSRSEEEKYIVRLRMAENAFAQKKHLEAQDHARYAIGLRPEYPDAYNLLGHINFELKQYERAKDMFMLGLAKKPPYYSIIVFNPRDYDYVPLMALAKVYFNLSLPMLALECLKLCLRINPQDENLKKLIHMMDKEAVKGEKILRIIKRLRTMKNKENLKKALEKIPDEFQDHPGIQVIRNTHFRKETSTGKDLVIFCGYTQEQWSPESVVKTGIGGSEEAVINLSAELVQHGWNVTVYNNCGHRGQVYKNVVWKPFWAWNHRDKQDVTIIWRHPKPLDYDINSERIYIDMHDVVPPGEFNEARLKRITKIFVKSKAHRALFPDVPDEKFAVIPNGIDTSLFAGEVERDPYLMVNTSSPDRSLDVLVDAFIEIKKRVPKAKLKWAYGWGVFDQEHANEPDVMRWKNDVLQKLASAGVEVLGRVSHAEVAKLYQSANLFVYPTEFYEIDCISARKAQLGGAVPITTDFAALNETVQYGFKVHSEKTKDTWVKPYQFSFGLEGKELNWQFVDECVAQLHQPYPEEARQRMKDWAKTFNWKQIGRKWHEQLEAAG